MKVIPVGKFQTEIYSLGNKVGSEIIVVNMKEHSIVMKLRVLEKPESVELKIPKEVITCES